MERLVLLAGLPGVGKSTIARGIASNQGGQVLNLDIFKRREVDPGLVTSQVDPPEVRCKYYKSGLQHALSLQGMVIMDEVFPFGKLRTRLEHACTQRGVRVEWIEVRCPYEIVERRLRSASRVGHILSTDEALRMYCLFEDIFEKFPDGKENHTVLDNS